MTTPHDESGPSADVATKSTLFCPRCGHQSQPDGDWLHVETAGGISYVCPCCGRQLTTRPGSETEHHPWVPDALWHTWEQSLDFWQTLLHRTLPP